MRRSPLEKTDLSTVTAYISAGGQGQRLRPVMAEADGRVSKAMLEVGDPPLRLIDHHINKLTAAQVGNIVVGAGDHTSVASYVREAYRNRPQVQTSLVYSQGGTAGDLVQAVRSHPDWFQDQIMVSNVDTILDISEEELTSSHNKSRRKNAALTIALTLRKGVPNENAFYVGDEDRIIYSREAALNAISEAQAKGRCNYAASSTGTVVVEKDFLEEYDWTPQQPPLSLYRDVIADALGREVLFGFNNQERFFIDIGTPETWEAAQEQKGLLQPYLAY